MSIRFFPIRRTGERAECFEALLVAGLNFNLQHQLRLTSARRLIERAMVEPGWVTAGHGWQGKQSTLRLVGWSRHRRVILLRRPIERTVAMVTGDGSGRQLDLYFGEITADPAAKVFEYAVLVTSSPRGADGRPALSRPGDRRKQFR